MEQKPEGADGRVEGLVGRLRQPIIADAFADGRIADGVLAEYLIRERHEAADWIERNLMLTNGEAVRIPTSEREAVLMVNLGTQYLRDHAPRRLETPNA